MAEIVNLRQARKARARQTAEQRAAERRTRFGETKAERKLRLARENERARLLDGARVETRGIGKSDDGNPNSE